ncbi:glycosyltransferase family 4 protein [Limnobaculum xujianqingii]|uniref:glycosyltransferase family 4 protein n=1 Tax=Limnobaculum xujianqingii TaxID=2738837 RepID=UPI001127AF71|nr:glycosyltransferase family 4 protein [Limnobaculum xujianqingii]
MKKKILYVVNVDWFFVSHRLPIALKAIDEGFEVYLACGITDKQEMLENLGLKIYPLAISRSGTSLLSELKLFFHIYKVVSKIKPDIIHMVTIKPVIYAGIASKLLNIKKRIFSISGLGYVFIASGFKATLFRYVISLFYRLSIKCKNSIVIFQNPDDKDLFLKLNIVNLSQSILIRGSGVNLDKYPVLPEPDGVPVVMLMARLLIDKGVLEFVEAAKILRNIIDVRMVLVGDVDDSYPNSITKLELESWVNYNVIEYWGYTDNPAKTISQSNIIVLPSYREGLPKNLIEAAACARAVITTDVPGCRDAIIPDVTGTLVPLKNVNALVDNILDLINNSTKRYSFAKQGRILAENAFNINHVINTHIDIYKS